MNASEGTPPEGTVDVDIARRQYLGPGIDRTDHGQVAVGSGDLLAGTHGATKDTSAMRRVSLHFLDHGDVFVFLHRNAFQGTRTGGILGGEPAKSERPGGLLDRIGTTAHRYRQQLVRPAHRTDTFQGQVRFVELLDAEHHRGVLKEGWRLRELARELIANFLGIRTGKLHHRHGQHPTLERKRHAVPVHFEAHCRTPRRVLVGG